MVKSYFGTFHYQIGEEGLGEKHPGFTISPKLSRDLQIDQLIIKKTNKTLKITPPFTLFKAAGDTYLRIHL